MIRFRDGLTLLASLGLLAVSAPAAAEEAPAFRPPAGLRRGAAPPPLRLAEGLSAEPLARLASAAVAAPAALEAMAAWNRNPRNPTKVGFARELATPLRLTLEPERLREQVGARVGGGFLSRERSGHYVWGTSVEVEDARALRLELSDVNLPAGTRLWVYGATGEARAFDLRRLRSDGSVLSPVIESDRIHLEVELPDGQRAAGEGFVVRRVQELIWSRGSLAPTATTADGCLQNAECYDSSDFPAIAVARDSAIQYIFTDGDTYICSATLMNDTVASTQEPWILTANHCIDSQDTAETMDMAFFYRRTGCGSSENDWVQGPIGADFIVGSADTDVTLVRAIDEGEIPDGAAFAGWTSVRPGNGTVLHRISHPANGQAPGVFTQMYSRHQVDTTPDFDCTDDGAPLAEFLYSSNLAGTGISGGSSGSAAMLANGQVVGQLLGSCGLPADGCGVDENQVDGAFAVSFPLLQPYLSPSGDICIRDADTACLLNGRIKVEVTWHTDSGNGPGQIMYFNGQRAENVESAFFWFFNATNFEMGVKAVDACVPPFNHFWVFVSGLTSQGYTVTVTKMSDPAHPRVYTNGIGEIPTTDADTLAFTCP